MLVTATISAPGGAPTRTSRRTIALPADSLPWMQPTTSMRCAAAGSPSTTGRMARPSTLWPIGRAARKRARSRTYGPYVCTPQRGPGASYTPGMKTRGFAALAILALAAGCGGSGGSGTTTSTGSTSAKAYVVLITDVNQLNDHGFNEIADGADVVFQVAGGCGLGVLDAAKAKGVWGIGVDADQSYLGPQVLTSALKRVDTSVYATIQQVLDGKFKGGTDSVFSLKNDGVGLGKISPKVPKADVQKVREIEKQIKAGTIADIPTQVQAR